MGKDEKVELRAHCLDRSGDYTFDVPIKDPLAEAGRAVAGPSLAV